VLETGGMEESLLSKDEDFEDNFTGVNNFFNFEGILHPLLLPVFRVLAASKLSIKLHLISFTSASSFS